MPCIQVLEDVDEMLPVEGYPMENGDIYLTQHLTMDKDKEKVLKMTSLYDIVFSFIFGSTFNLKLKLGYAKAAHRIALSYYAWNWSKSLCAVVWWLCGVAWKPIIVFTLDKAEQYLHFSLTEAIFDSQISQLEGVWKLGQFNLLEAMHLYYGIMAMTEDSLGAS